ncbi:uncharacterized protein LOC132306762 [Cornus florida]|uniref:uncharacterized protein LOC132306762 n=1 Tax=Cornus florida TaxID=4283 RepID=UPI0028A20ECE|nr:uncharacterized protein LOC132306762 [Cornus florida]XP_059660297.1 uncharacterized protein LOC132306762 [Cornus florida]
MGWSHPDISLTDLLKLIKGFVDILILASGYQSTGNLAHWDAQNIKKVFQWGLFFENVFMRLSHLDDYQDSVKELDAALSEMTSNPNFPQGLAHLSSVTLSRARDFVVKQLIHALPMRDPHLRASILATIEMDLDELQRTESDYLHVYLEKLILQNSSWDPVLYTRDFSEDSTISSPNIQNRKTQDCISGEFTKFTIQELRRRQLVVSCISSAETGLDILSKIIRQTKWTDSDISLFKKQSKHATASLTEEELVESVTWNHWRSGNLSYLLDKRTIGLVSGASMIFSAPKIQWIHVLERLKVSVDSSNCDLHEIIELLLLGCIASRWNSLIEHFMSVSKDSLTISKQYHEVHNLLQVKFQNRYSKEEMINLKEKGILDYLEKLLAGQLHQLWKLSPALGAAAIPSWSHLFRLYLSELECQFKGDSPTIRCCSCIQDRKEHKDCELAERIWCLHIFHVRGSHVMCPANVA